MLIALNMYMNGKIYYIKNKLNGKGYIGLTTQEVSERFKQHCRGGYILHNAIKKYGEENFEILTICEGIKDINILETLEKENILKFKTHISEHGYNVTRGGGLNDYIFNQQGKEVSDETKIKMSKNHADVSGSNNPNYKKMVILTPDNQLILRNENSQQLIDSFEFTNLFLSGEKFLTKSKNEGFYFEVVENYDFDINLKIEELKEKRDDWWYNENSENYRYAFERRKPPIEKQINIFISPDGDKYELTTKKEFWDFCKTLGVKAQDVKALRDGKRKPFTNRSNFYGWQIILGENNESKKCKN